MRQKKKDAIKKEARRFTLAGTLSTSLDYSLLNAGTVLLGLPLITANIISTTLASIASFIMNKKVVFKGQQNNNRQTIIYFILINGTSIYIIQSIVLYLIGHRFDRPTDIALNGLESVGFPYLNETFVSTNLAKICASIIAGVWNFFLLRKYVFKPQKIN